VTLEGGADSEDRYAYTLSEVENMLDALTNETQETIITVAMHTGLRRFEIRGLKWSDLILHKGSGRNILSVSRRRRTIQAVAARQDAIANSSFENWGMR
jgi:integrase